MKIELQEVTTAAQLEGLRDEWRTLHDACPDVTLFQSWEWLSTWWRHLADGTLWVLAARADGRLVGLAPFYLWRTPRGRRSVRFIGAGVTDYLDFIILPEARAACLRRFEEHLLRHQRRWRFVQLDDVRRGRGAAHEFVLGAIPVEEQVVETCPYLELPRSRDLFREGLPRNLRKQLPRYQRRLAERFRTEYRVAGPEDLQLAVTTLIDLHQRAWIARGEPGVLAGAAIQRFQHEVCARLLERGWLRLHMLWLDEQLRGLVCCFVHGGHTHAYLMGWDQELRSMHAGTLLIAHAIGHAIEEGCAEFDFMRGDEGYKENIWQAKGGRENLRRQIVRSRTRLDWMSDALWGSSLAQKIFEWTRTRQPSGRSDRTV